MSINLIACFSLDLKDPGAQNLGRGLMGGEWGSKTGRFFKDVLLNLGDQECLGSTMNNKKLFLINLKINESECQSILALKRSGILSIFYLPENSGRTATGISPVISTQ